MPTPVSQEPPSEAPPAAQASMFCRNCNYDLRGLPTERCPECGRAFDPADSHTFSSRPIPRWARFFCNPPSWLLLPSAITATLLGIVCYSVPGGHVDLLGWCVAAWLLVWAYWLLHVLRPWAIDDRFRRTDPRFAGRRHWLAAPLLFAMMLVLLFLDVPARITFRISKPAMDQCARGLLNQGPGASAGTPVRLGLYRFGAIDTMELTLARRPDKGGGTFLMTLVVCSLSDHLYETDSWLVYCPGDPLDRLPDTARETVTRLGGDWYCVSHRALE